MPWSRNAETSFNNKAIAALPLRRIRADPGLGPGIAVTAAHQMHQLLRGGLVSTPAIATLLGHRATDPGRFGFPSIMGARLRPQVTADPLYRLAARTNRGLLANIDAATAHACHPLLVSKTTRDCSKRLHVVRAAEPLLQQRKVKKSPASNRRVRGW